jgi:TatA/E family protein of Tat protein translocase
MFDIGLQELVLIFVIALLVFGPKNLPQLGRSLGRAMREFRRASDEFRSTIETNLKINEPDPVADVALEVTPPDPAPAATTAATDPISEPGADPYAEPQGAEPASGEPYVAPRGGKLFHGRDCPWVGRVGEPERMYFKSVADARDAGFLGCPSCEPWEAA